VRVPFLPTSFQKETKHRHKGTERETPLRCALRCPPRSPLPLPAHAPPGNTPRVRAVAFLRHAHPAGGASARPPPRPSPRALASRIDDDDRSTSCRSAWLAQVLLRRNTTTMNVNTARFIISAYAYDPSSSEKKIGIQIEAYLDADMTSTEVEALGQFNPTHLGIFKHSHASTMLFSDGALVTYGAQVIWDEADTPPIVDASLLNLLAIALAKHYGVSEIITIARFEDNYANVAFARRGVENPVTRTFSAITRPRRDGEDSHLFTPSFAVMYDHGDVHKRDKDRKYFDWKFGVKFTDDKEDDESSPSAKRSRA
jgi:hypothetical protein